MFLFTYMLIFSKFVAWLRYIKTSEAIPQKDSSECFCFSRCKVDVIHYEVLKIKKYWLKAFSHKANALNGS